MRFRHGSPDGWDKRKGLERIAGENFREIHFFGDKTYQGVRRRPACICDSRTHG